jgi:acyl transferase domain-containing protein/acyl-CoA synthetase (AMP-forming)/AMP-acid ligase II/acyl carrier protein
MITSLLDILSDRAKYLSEKQAYIFLQDGETESGSLNYGELDRQARAIAAKIQFWRGERALLMYPSGLEFITAFFGCLYAGVIAVPVYPPRRNQNMSRLQAIMLDSQATLALTTTALLSGIENSWSQDSELPLMHLLATDSISSELDLNWQQPIIISDDLAFLQYTSGSTGTPKGVMVSHANLLHNSNYIKQAFELTSESISVSWLPSFHDMGLIDGIIQPIYTGFLSILMAPSAFVQKPIRWLQVITYYRATHCGGPDFGYSHCISKVTPEQRQSIDLSSWSSAYSGAEPIRRETLEQFTQMFEMHGFDRRSFYPCYGMAETTLMVSGGVVKQEPVYCDVRAELFAENRVVKTTAGSHNIKQLVGSGRSWLDVKIVIVDPELLTRCAPDQIGEIWVSGASVTQGYWNRPEETMKTFQAYLQGTGEGPFLRTGDLGFLDNEELFITGRLKDVIIIRGRNHYPQDIELTAEKSHPALRKNCSAAFTIKINEEERLIVLCEVERTHLRKLNFDEIVTAIKIAISTEHELDLHEIVLLKTGSISKTSSGKIQRHTCKAGFLAGNLNIVEQWQKQCQKSINLLPSLSANSLDSQEHNHSKTVGDIEVWLSHKIAEIQELPIKIIDFKQPLTVYGLNSVKAVSISTELSEWLGILVAPTIIYDYPSVQLLAEHLGRPTSPGKFSPVVANPPQETAAIAIVGKGCRLPKADNPEAFWSLLRSGQDAITKVPASRWGEDPSWGGFLERVDLFDPQFFNISPREAQSIDPQQRLLLEVSWEALENAGIAAEKLTGSRSGVFIGISYVDYAKLAGNIHTTEAYYGTGTALSLAANRLSYFLDWQGPSWVVDTACSSSLVAVHQACQSLLLGECNLALAGGISLILSPQLTRIATNARMIAADGRCKTFDAKADGYVRSEGCGVVVLKRLSDAIADGDNIQAIIRGSAVNQDGSTNGITAPNGNSQQQVIRLALANAGVKPNQISYVEAHGTGTPLGDPIEIDSLKTILMEERELNQPCWIGSVKTNIGHLEAAAGIASLIKVVLSLEHSEIPPHLHLNKLNPYIELDQTAIKIPTQLQSWSSVNPTRIAGVSAFGFGGTNAHVILEAAPVGAKQSENTQPAEKNLQTKNQDLLERPIHLLTLSAKTDKALQDLVLSYQTHLNKNQGSSISDLCFSANTGRSHFKHRLAIIAADQQELANKLARISAQSEPLDVFTGQLPSNYISPKTAFLFTGQGSQYAQMGCQLYQTQPTFRQALDACAQLMEPDLEQPLLSILYPEERDRHLIDRTMYAQPALFALEYALCRLWQSWGIVPTAVLGHSVGEYVAAVIAGVISLADGVKLVITRAKLMQSLPSTGEMVAVFATPDEIQKVVTIDGQNLSFAAYNSPQNTVISGENSAITTAGDALTNAGIGFTQLRTSHAFHSVLMEPILAQFRQVSAAISYHPPQIPLISNLTGQQIGANEIDAEYWCQHLRQTVKFADGLQTLDKLGIDIFLEIGSKPTLIGIAQQCLTASDSWHRRGSGVVEQPASPARRLGADAD